LYTFQVQEKQEETGWNSFKWRNYDPSFGRFFNVDPLAEEYAYQSPYNFSENAVVNARELEGLEKVLIFGNQAATAGAVARPSQSTGAYTELKRHTQTSQHFWAGVADKNYNIIRASGMVEIALANRILNSISINTEIRP
jgi:RHS repeat-associated protein